MDNIREICLAHGLELLCDWSNERVYLSLVERQENTIWIVADGAGDTFDGAIESLLWDWHEIIGR